MFNSLIIRVNCWKNKREAKRRLDNMEETFLKNCQILTRILQDATPEQRANGILILRHFEGFSIENLEDVKEEVAIWLRKNEERYVLRGMNIVALNLSKFRSTEEMVKTFFNGCTWDFIVEWWWKWWPKPKKLQCSFFGFFFIY